MSGANVKNHFNQTPGPQGAEDNELVLDGTVTQGAGGIITLAGDNVISGNNAFSGDNTHSGTETFSGPVESAGGADLKTKLVTVKIPDISAASSVWVVPGIAGTVVKISSVIDGAIITADAVLDPQIGGVSITDGGITIAFTGSAAGIVDQATPSAANTITASEAVEIATDGGSTNSVAAVITLEILPT